MSKEKINRNYIHTHCGGEIEEIEKLDSLDKILHCLKCDEKWEEKLVIIDEENI